MTTPNLEAQRIFIPVLLTSQTKDRIFKTRQPAMKPKLPQQMDKENMLIEAKLTGPNGHLQIYSTDPTYTHNSVVVCVHGGPNGNHRGNSDIFVEISEYISNFNFGLITFDMYGSGKSDGRQRDFSLTTQIDDYQCVLNFARTHYKTIVPIGESMGSTIVSMCWQKDFENYIHLWPAFDLFDTDLRPYFDEKWMSLAHKNGYIADAGMEMSSSFIEQIISTKFDRSFVLPEGQHLLIHGKSDTAVPFEQSVRAVREAKGCANLCAVPDGDHGLQQVHERAVVHQIIKAWLSTTQ